MDYEAFKKEIYQMTGINLDYYKEKQMKRRIDSLIRKNEYEGYQDYVKALKADKELYDEFVNYLTINVSEFYRNPEQWQVLEKEILPMILSKTNAPKIWSAACSTGDEPYTIAMILSKFIPLQRIKIIATDVDQQALNKAMAGIYTSRSLENLPKVYLDQFFTKSDQVYTINQEVKNCIQFKKHNLLKDEYPKDCDLIVCRNVLIYFTEEAKEIIYKNFSNSLKPEASLFVGSTEQIMMSHRFNLKSLKTFFYIKDKA